MAWRTATLSNKDSAYNVLDHHANSSAAVELSQATWGGAATVAKPNLPSFSTPVALNDILKAARASQKQDHDAHVALRHRERQPGVRTVHAATSAHVHVWLAELRTRRNADGRLVANEQQLAVVSDVAHRVIQELDSTGNDEADADEPLRKLAHGGPGTSKTHVIKLVKELFEDVLDWQQGVRYQVVAFQAVMAHLIGGDTIHHALGIPVFTDGRSSEEQLASHMTVSKRMLQCRWLIIDEISMVSSQLLALVDVKLREVVRDLQRAKRDANQDTRPFGGLNVLLWRFLAAPSAVRRLPERHPRGLHPASEAIPTFSYCEPWPVAHVGRQRVRDPRRH